VQISEERKKRVIDLYFNQHKSYAEIAQIERISPRDIHAIIKEEQARRQQYRHQQQQEERSSKAYKLFSAGKRLAQVATILKLREPEVSKLHKEYWKLRGRDILNLIYKETNGNTWPFWKLYKELVKKRGMSIEQVVNAVEIAIHKLPYMESPYRQAKDQAEKMQHTVQRLANDIAGLEHKISILDKIALSSEQECRRKHREIQELNDRKNRIERLIANILNGEGYSKLKHIIKKNVKAVLSDNKILISTAFAAVIQTLKDNPGIANSIYNIDRPNDVNHKDNNNIIKFIEVNKDKILDLTEKKYENLVEALTNNAISTAASSDQTLSLPQSSSTSPNPLNQSDTYRKEESEYFHHSKGDIAE
jgi:predicted DNA-binding protein YlxM (UPF0122 family)